jgi:hypothetical protein
MFIVPRKKHAIDFFHCRVFTRHRPGGIETPTRGFTSHLINTLPPMRPKVIDLQIHRQALLLKFDVLEKESPNKYRKKYFGPQPIHDNENTPTEHQRLSWNSRSTD